MNELKNANSESVALLGCGRGLGAAVVAGWPDSLKSVKAVLSSKKIERLRDVVEEHKIAAEIFAHDYSKTEQVALLFEQLEKYNPQRIFYFAGGGPYGEYGKFEWKDHLWALQVSFLTPAMLVHWALIHYSTNTPQIIFIGSAVAEGKPDPFAASYSAAKHALVGLVSSVQIEYPAFDLRLFSPSYMNTDLLPANCGPRRNAVKLLNPEEVAKDFWNWALSDDHQGHLSYL